MLACRLCRVPLAAADGCAVCNPIRHNLVVVGESEDERPSLSGVSAEVVTTLRSQVTHLTKALKSDPDNDSAHKKLVATANSMAKVLGEARKLQEDGKDAVDNMNFAEKAKLFIEWIATLPPAYRQGIREQMADFEARVSAPVKPNDEPVLS
jgi:uncharacterized Zn finger protein (UPF0148 family)